MTSTRFQIVREIRFLLGRQTALHTQYPLTRLFIHIKSRTPGLTSERQLFVAGARQTDGGQTGLLGSHKVSLTSSLGISVRFPESRLWSGIQERDTKRLNLISILPNTATKNVTHPQRGRRFFL